MVVDGNFLKFSGLQGASTSLKHFGGGGQMQNITSPARGGGGGREEGTHYMELFPERLNNAVARRGDQRFIPSKLQTEVEERIENGNKNKIFNQGGYIK